MSCIKVTGIFTSIVSCVVDRLLQLLEFILKMLLHFYPRVYLHQIIEKMKQKLQYKDNNKLPTLIYK